MSSDLAYKLRKVRQTFGLTHAEMAKELRQCDLPKLKLTTEMIRQFEAATHEPSEAVLRAYAKVSHFPVESLTNDEIKPFFEQCD
jgi:transcriptional regulator with XRE-family HTH domain